MRLDERIVADVGGAVVRFRYRLRGTHPIGGSRWYGVISDEVMANLNDYGSGPVSGLEQNRLRFTVGLPFLDRLRVESGYEWQYVEGRSSAASHYHVFVVEFTIDTGGRRLIPWSPRWRRPPTGSEAPGDLVRDPADQTMLRWILTGVVALIAAGAPASGDESRSSGPSKSLQAKAADPTEPLAGCGKTPCMACNPMVHE